MQLHLLALLCATQLAVASASLSPKKHVQVVKRQNTSASAALKTASVPASAANVPTATASGIPPLSAITMGMPSGATPVVTVSYSAGAEVPIPSAPSLPSPCTQLL